MCHCELGRGQKGTVTGVWPLAHAKALSPNAMPLCMHLWGRTAAPLPRRKSTTGIVRRTAGDVITGDITLRGLGVWQAELGWGLLHPVRLTGLLFTGTLLCVTPKPGRAAVYVVLTAHSLGWIKRKWA